MEENKVATDKDLAQRATRIIVDYFGDNDVNRVLLHGLIFRELVAVRDQAIEQCGVDCQYDKGYEDGYAAKSGVYHIEHLDSETVRLIRK